MTAETFADGIGRIGFTEGMVRIELVSIADQDQDARDPATWAGACVELLSAAGAPHRGRIWKPDA